MIKRVITLFALCIVLGACALFAAYLHIDSQVQDRLQVRKDLQAPGIYSRPFDIYSGKRIPAEVLHQALEERQYKRVRTRPTKPGEYYEEGGVFEIFAREFYHPKDGLQPYAVVLYHSEKGLVQNDTDPDLESFSLEPVLVSPLGTQDIRASSFRPLSAFPEHAVKMLLAAEDHRFYEHEGVDPIGIGRAMVKNILAGRIVQGGSTLTQQLAKNLLFSPRRSLTRKILEALAAISLETHYSKDEILEMYLNDVYLGQEGSVAIHGFPEASHAFFRKRIEQITPAEAALLAGIIRAPSYNAPRAHPDRARERRDVILERALELDFISKAVFDKAVAARLTIAPEPKFKRNAPFFEAALLQTLQDSVNTEALARSGVRVYSGLDLSLQKCAQNAVEESLAQIEKTRPATRKIPEGLEVGLVSIEPFSGLVRAWVGGRNYSKNQFDHVYQAKRQVGSTIKPFVYLTALDTSLNSYKTATAASIIRDSPYKVEQPGQPAWRPENYDKKYRGDVTLRYALEKSLNIPAVYVAMRVGIPAVARTIGQFHIAEEVPTVPSIALGALDTTLLKLTSAYATLANNGVYVEPRLFIHAIDSSGAVLTTSPIYERRTGNEAATYVVTNILQGVLDRGTGTVVRRQGFSGTAAGKTGTSNDTRDSWFIGYTPRLATGVWIGNDANHSTGLTGASGAGVIWGAYMRCAERFTPDEPFMPPRGVVFSDIDTRTGKRVSADCPGSGSVKEVFVEGTVPSFLCDRPYGAPTHIEQPSDRERPVRKRKRKSLWDLLFSSE